MILDGLDTTTALGINSRLFLNNVRDERVDQSFDLVSKKVFAETDSNHKSCLALFHLSVLYNWAYLIADQQLNSKQPFTTSIIKVIQDILDRAQENVPLLAGEDVV